MAELKTRRTAASPAAFVTRIPDERKRRDAKALLALMKRVTGSRPEMWGSSIVGFGRYHYKYESGWEGDWFLTGFSPRKQSLTVYLMSGFKPYSDLLAQLGKHKTGAGCLYVKSLDDVDLGILAKLIRRSVRDTETRYGR